ncbi:MAG: hypothetical protein QM529_05930 [Hydrotalea sp.]|nr:hypothetical protein [Hydrotalea sp.]
MAKTNKSSDNGLLSSLMAFVGRDMGISLLLGIATGISLLFTGNLLAGLSSANPPMITAAVATLIFTLKFLFAPLIDKLPAPWLGKKFGQRRGMAMWLQILSIICLLVTLFARNMQGMAAVLIGAVIVVVGAFQIMALDALRVEMLSAKKQAHGITMSVIGYFLLSIAIGVLAPWLAKVGIDFIMVFAALQLLGLWAIIMVPMTTKHQEFSFGALVAPFADVFKSKQIWSLFALLLLYKYGNSMMSLLSINFYNGLGFQNEELKSAAGIVQNMGPLVAIVGLILGAVVTYCMGLYRALMIGIVLAMVAPIFFPIMLRVGPNLPMLFATVSIANISEAMTTVAILALAARMVNPKHSVTQWAFLTSVVAFTSLASASVVPTVTTLPLIPQFLLTIPTTGLLQLLKVSSPEIIAVAMIILSVPGLLILLATKKTIESK